MKTIRTLSLILLVAVQSACATYESWPGSTRSEDQAPAPVVRQTPDQPPGTTQGGPVTPPADSVEVGITQLPEVSDASVQPPTGPAGFLLEQAESLRKRGDLTAAATSIERAMRIQPGNPWLSFRLGEIRLAQGNAQQAELLAQRALTQSGGDRELKSRRWRLTSAARAARGDQSGAAAALAQAGE